jgi:hypothetical protein
MLQSIRNYRVELDLLDLISRRDVLHLVFSKKFSLILEFIEKKASCYDHCSMANL